MASKYNLPVILPVFPDKNQTFPPTVRLNASERGLLPPGATVAQFFALATKSELQGLVWIFAWRYETLEAK